MGAAISAFRSPCPNVVFSSLTLKMRYDDGFVAYLNGAEVARRNCTGDPQWNSVASAANPDQLADPPGGHRYLQLRRPAADRGPICWRSTG